MSLWEVELELGKRAHMLLVSEPVSSSALASKLLAPTYCSAAHNCPAEGALNPPSNTATAIQAC